MASFISHKTMNKGKPPMKLITPELVQRVSMKSELDKVLDLDLTSQSITEIENRNGTLTKMAGTLRTLDLSMNLLTSTENIDIVTSLRELNLSFNQLTVIESVPKLANLRILELDFNKITRICNIRGLRKLERLSLQGNLIEDFSCLEFVDPMIELKELNLSQNRIKTIECIKNVPNLDQLNLNENPISLIFPDAFTQVNELGTLLLDKVAIKNPFQDLEFLKKLEGHLSMLSMNNAFPKQNLTSLDALSFLKMSSCLNVHLQGVGLEDLDKI